MIYTLTADNISLSTTAFTLKSANLVKKDESKNALTNVKTNISGNMTNTATNSIDNSLLSQKSLILAVETSGRLGSVAIATGPQLITETTFSAPMTHSVEIFPMIDNLLSRFSRKPKDIEQIYISVGPGSFTGLRIAVTMAKTMHLANTAKIVAVDTLDVIAANVISLTKQNSTQESAHRPQVVSPERVAVILDAKRGQFFVAVYQRLELNTNDAENNSKDPMKSVSNKKWQKIVPDSLMTASQLLEKFADPEHPTWLLGEGLVYYKDKFRNDGTRFFDQRYWSPSARNVHLLGWEMARAGRFSDALTLQPTYLRRPEAEEK